MSNLTIVTEPTENNQVLKKLFREVYIGNDHEMQTPDDVAKVRHFGNNGRKIFIGVTSNDGEILKPADRTLLQKILAAVKLSEDDVFIASINDILPASFNNFIEGNAFDKLFFFGVEPIQFNWHLDIVQYQRTFFSDKELLFAESLSVLSTNDLAKKKLWMQLQLIFNLK
jgi:hypothetical protein